MRGTRSAPALPPIPPYEHPTANTLRVQMRSILFLAVLAPATLGRTHANCLVLGLEPNSYSPAYSAPVSAHCNGLSPLGVLPPAAACQSAASVTGLPLHQRNGSVAGARWAGALQGTGAGAGSGWGSVGAMQPFSPGPAPLPLSTRPGERACAACNDAAWRTMARPAPPALAAAGGVLCVIFALLAWQLPLAVALTRRIFCGAFACEGGSIGGRALPASSTAQWRGAPHLFCRLCAFALFLASAHAGCPGSAMPGNYCVGSAETLCPAQSFCMGGGAAAVPCTVPENCAAAGLSAEPPSPRHLAMSVTCTNVIPTTVSAFTSYGLVPTSGTFFYCTSATGSSYIDRAFQASLHVAPPGYRIVLAITQWNTEPSYDEGTIFLTNNSASPTTNSACSLSGVARGGIPLFSGGSAGPYVSSPPGSPLSSPYGGGIGLCFFSDSRYSEDYDGIGYSITAQACPAGFFCPNNALNATPCAAVRILCGVIVFALSLYSYSITNFNLPPHCL